MPKSSKIIFFKIYLFTNPVWNRIPKLLRAIIMVHLVLFTFDPEITAIHTMFRRCYFFLSCHRNSRLEKYNAMPQSKGVTEMPLKICPHQVQLYRSKTPNDFADCIKYYASKNHYQETLYKSGMNYSSNHNCNYISYNAAFFFRYFEVI